MKVSKNLSRSLLVAALGFSKRYQRKAVDLVKIEGASFYLRGVQLARRQSLIVLATLFSLIVLTTSTMVLPLGLIYYSSWAAQTKMIATCLVGMGFAAIALTVLWIYFSEGQWMKFTRANDLLREVFKES